MERNNEEEMKRTFSKSMVRSKLTEKDLQFILSEGEGYLVEFKESLSDSLARELVAFANSSGGRIFIGISDDGRIVGADRSNRIKSQIQDMARNCDPPITVIIEHIEKVLVVNVREGTDKPYQCKDGFFSRVGPNAQKLRRNELIEFFKREGKTRFDDQYCMDFQYPKDFSQERFRKFLQACQITTRISTEMGLINLGLAQSQGGRLLFKNAGVLLFAKEPRRFHLQAMITCARFKGTNKMFIIDRKDFTQDVMTNVDDAMKWLQTYVPLRYEITGESLRRKEIPEIPYDALREALLNSVIHRDYFERGAVTMVEFYDDRIEITNPGGLAGGMGIEELGKKSVSRNPLLFDIFHRTGNVEKMGSGILRIRGLMKKAGLLPPKFEVDGFFSISFTRPHEARNEAINEARNEARNEPIKIILIQLLRYSNANLLVLESATGFSRAKLQRYVAMMKKDDLIRYIGPLKNGHYEITDKGKTILNGKTKKTE